LWRKTLCATSQDGLLAVRGPRKAIQSLKFPFARRLKTGSRSTLEVLFRLHRINLPLMIPAFTNSDLHVVYAVVVSLIRLRQRYLNADTRLVEKV
jgi:hypothetical protein